MRGFVVCVLIPLCAAQSVAAGADPFFGLNAVGFFHYRDQPDAAKTAAQKMAWLKQAGAKSDRFDFWWGEIEPKPGEWKWNKADWLVNFYTQQHIAMLPILCYRANWMNDPPHSEEDFKAFATYTKQV